MKKMPFSEIKQSDFAGYGNINKKSTFKGAFFEMVRDTVQLSD